MAQRNHYKSGFSIVELSIVITIIAILLSSSLAVGVKWLENHRTQTAEQYVKAISASLDNFYRERGYYPCPTPGSRRPDDTGYGEAISSCHSSTCPAGLSCNNDVVIGTVPFSTLGIAIAEDPWSNKFLYAVDKKLTDLSNNVCVLRGSIRIQGDGNNAITENAAYVVLSHGAGENGAFRTKSNTARACDAGRDDQENCSNTRTFRQYNVIDSDFTSILHWKLLDNTITPKTRGDTRNRKPHQIPGHVYTYIPGESTTAIPTVQVESIVARFGAGGGTKKVRARTTPNTGQFSIEVNGGNIRIRYQRSHTDLRPELDKEYSFGAPIAFLTYIYNSDNPDGRVRYQGVEHTSWDRNIGDLRHLRDFLVVNQRLLTTEGLRGISFFDRPIGDSEGREVDHYMIKCAP